MTVSGRTLLKAIASLALTVVFLWYAFSTVNLTEVGHALSMADPTGLLMGVGMVFIATFPRGWRWQLLMRNVANPSIKRVFGAILVGYAANNIVPRSGEIARIFSLRQPGATSGLLASVLVERIIDLLTLLVLFAFVLQIVPVRIVQAYPWLEAALVSGSIATGIGAVAVLAVAILAVSIAGHRALSKIRHLLDRLSPATGERMSSILESFVHGLGAVRTPGGYARVLAHTILLNLCYALSVYLPFASFGFVERYGLSFGDAIVVMAIATIGIVIPTPGGAGTYHVFCSQALTRLYGVPSEESLAFATALHGGVFLVFMITGGPLLIRLLWERRKEPPPSPDIERSGTTP